MYNHMTWEFKPSNFINILTISFHQTVSGCLFVIKLKDEFGFQNSSFRIEFHRKVWDHYVVFSDNEIVNHSLTYKRNLMS